MEQNKKKKEKKSNRKNEDKKGPLFNRDCHRQHTATNNFSHAL